MIKIDLYQPYLHLKWEPQLVAGCLITKSSYDKSFSEDIQIFFSLDIMWTTENSSSRFSSHSCSLTRQCKWAWCNIYYRGKRECTWNCIDDHVASASTLSPTRLQDLRKEIRRTGLLENIKWGVLIFFENKENAGRQLLNCSCFEVDRHIVCLDNMDRAPNWRWRSDYE